MEYLAIQNLAHLILAHGKFGTFCFWLMGNLAHLILEQGHLCTFNFGSWE